MDLRWFGLDWLFKCMQRRKAYAPVVDTSTVALTPVHCSHSAPDGAAQQASSFRTPPQPHLVFHANSPFASLPA